MDRQFSLLPQTDATKVQGVLEVTQRGINGLNQTEKLSSDEVIQALLQYAAITSFMTSAPERRAFCRRVCIDTIEAIFDRLEG